MRKYNYLKARNLFSEGAMTLDNVVLAPANLLSFKTQWQKVANSLPQGGILIVLPSASRQREILEQVTEELRKIGRHVRTVSAEAHELDEDGAPRGDASQGVHTVTVVSDQERLCEQ
jgi:hypothetical protein